MSKQTVRFLRTLTRSLHIPAVAIVIGAWVLGQPEAAEGLPMAAAVVSGVVLGVLFFEQSVAWLLEVRGLVVLAKVAVILTLPLVAIDHAGPTLLAVAFVASVSSHMPGRLRHFRLDQWLRERPRREALQRYVEAVREAANSGSSQDDILARVQQASERELGADWRVPDCPKARTEPKRVTLHAEPAGFVVVAIIWPAGGSVQAHDHGEWGLVRVIRGGVIVTNYACDGADDQGGLRLRETERIEAGRGAFAYVRPLELDFHAIANRSRVLPAVTLHTYGKRLAQTRMVDPETGAVRLVAGGATAQGNAAPDKQS